MNIKLQNDQLVIIADTSEQESFLRSLAENQESVEIRKSDSFQATHSLPLSHTQYKAS